MYIVLIPRVGLPHIFNFILSTGKYRMLCGKDMARDMTINSFAGDALFPGVCPVCTKHAVDMYEDDLRDDPRSAHNSWQSRLQHFREYHYQEILGPINNVSDMENRVWSKLNKAKRKIQQRKK